MHTLVPRPSPGSGKIGHNCWALATTDSSMAGLLNQPAGLGYQEPVQAMGLVGRHK